MTDPVPEDSKHYCSASPDDADPRFMDAAIGYMNRRLQDLIDLTGERLYALGAFCKGSLGKACSGYADGGDFYSTMLGVQVKVYLEGTGADSAPGPNLGQIVRNRNHFMYRYPKIIRNSGGKVPSGEYKLLRETIAAIELRHRTFDEAFDRRLKIQSKSKTVEAGKNSRTRPQRDMEKIQRAIDNAVPRDRTMIPLSQLSSLVQAAVPGQNPQKVLGKKLKEYLDESPGFYTKETNGGVKVGRKRVPCTIRPA